MGAVIGLVLMGLKSRALLKGSLIGAAGAALSEFFNIDLAREEAVKVSPTSDAEGLEFAARAVHWMMGLTDGNVIGPRDIKNWNYFHYNPRKGEGWWTFKYNSGKSMGRARAKGARRGWGKGWSRANQTRQLSK